MHVLIIPSEHYVTKRVPLGGIFQRDLANALVADGTKVGVVAPGFISPRGLFSKYLYEKVEFDHSVDVVRDYRRRLVPEHYVSVERLIAQYTKVGNKLFRDYVKDNGPPDLIHAHGFIFAGSIAKSIFESTGISYAVTEHNSAFQRGVMSQRFSHEVASVAISAAGISAVSSALVDSIYKYLGSYDGRISVLPNLLPQDLKRPIRLRNDKLNEKFTYIAVGALDENKNHELLIRAFENLDRRESVRLIIVGSGPLHRRLELLTKELKINNQVLFVGYKNRDEVAKLMSESNCLVVSSQVETFGVVILEALASGIPVVSTRCGGPDSIVSSSNGLLVELGDVDQMTSAMDEIRSRYQDFDPESLRSDVVERFGHGSYLRGVHEFYRLALTALPA
ncbi:MAG: glycosyltransferase [Acidimicrobiaceae bacterium]|nr:glycosyltransferase [Acidimicrobiaceae bacterium]